MSNDRKVGGLVGLFGVSMAVCCGLPVLLGAGIAVGAAGVALGSGLVVIAGVVLGVWGWRRHRAAGTAKFPARGSTSDPQPSLTRFDEQPDRPMCSTPTTEASGGLGVVPAPLSGLISPLDEVPTGPSTIGSAAMSDPKAS